MIDTIRAKIRNGERVEREEGVYLLRDAPLLDLAPLAMEVRYRHNPMRRVTFVVDTNLNYTNVCDVYCTFCAFYRRKGQEGEYTYTIDQMMEQFGRAERQGVTTILLQGGLNDELPMEYYTELVRETIKRFPHIHPHFYSAPEIMKMKEITGWELSEVFAKLRQAGLKTIPGGGAEILTDRVKHKISRLFPKGKTADWIDVHREAHRAGLKSTATMMYGHVETDDDIIEHFDAIRDLQDETSAFTAFIPWSYKREQTALGRKIAVEAGPNRYLRIVAVARLYLDNFPHIQASWFSEGKKTGVVALNFGGDDFGGTIFDETVMQLAGHYNRTTVGEIIELIRDAGFVPAQRTTLYEILREFPEGPAEEAAKLAVSGER
ncbi:MAG: dehypoxanthine futalosine cyclase [Candidatus Krumholzibacteria bacterium]|nr:dehypoxanthine futalosine cyclase [Candidatus Krumholzibacteria bacterium]